MRLWQCSQGADQSTFAGSGQGAFGALKVRLQLLLVLVSRLFGALKVVQWLLAALVWQHSPARALFRATADFGVQCVRCLFCDWLLLGMCGLGSGSVWCAQGAVSVSRGCWVWCGDRCCWCLFGRQNTLTSTQTVP